MVKQSLTIEIKDYLDERFDHVLDKIRDIDNKITKINGSVGDTKNKVDKNATRIIQMEGFVANHTVFKTDLENVKVKCDRIQQTQRWIFVALIVGSFLWVKESRDFIVHAVLGTLGGL